MKFSEAGPGQAVTVAGLSMNDLAAHWADLVEERVTYGGGGAEFRLDAEMYAWEMIRNFFADYAYQITERI